MISEFLMFIVANGVEVFNYIGTSKKIFFIKGSRKDQF